MLFNCKKCTSLTIDYVNKSSGLDLHRFNWLESDNQIGSIMGDGWNRLLLDDNKSKKFYKDGKSKLVHWTLGGPWFKDQRTSGGTFSTDWFCARDEAMRLWE